jgi:hypothetical protein
MTKIQYWGSCRIESPGIDDKPGTQIFGYSSAFSKACLKDFSVWNRGLDRALGWKKQMWLKNLMTQPSPFCYFWLLQGSNSGPSAHNIEGPCGKGGHVALKSTSPHVYFGCAHNANLGFQKRNCALCALNLLTRLLWLHLVWKYG